uniref:Thioredoxin domain-containing protein n=1 Tax=Batrachochytrium dendrobatidis (strain JAM81 / FGSC 10211) TaxID=684364 RepID=F4PFL5_BATDJ|eukprot:XP_006683398.1 hypothetical protein BATDEDRAFT_28911 [Batrachochytrium dendrobatidis JAM81]
MGGINVNLEQTKKNKKNKKRNRLILRTSILAVLLSAVVFALVSNLRADNTVYQVGDRAPDFKLKQINKNNELEYVQLSDFEGKGVMLNFWGTWCKPCEAEMPYMEALYPEYKEKGIEIIAVSLDNTELAVDGEVRDLYKIGPIPSTVFINPSGEIERTVIGALTLEKLEGYFQEILPQK